MCNAFGSRTEPSRIGGGLRIAAREQDDVMSERDELVGQPRNDTLGAAIELRRNGLGQRGYLRDVHGTILFSNPTGPCTLQLKSLAARAHGATAFMKAGRSQNQNGRGDATSRRRA